MSSTEGSLPYFFPKWIDRLGFRYMNPWMRRLAPSLPGYAVVEHIGRKSGNRYEAPVRVFRKGDVMAVLLLHGETDRARNVIAAGRATLRHRRTTEPLRDPRILRPREATPDVPRLARLVNRIAGILVFRTDDDTARTHQFERDNLDELVTAAEAEHGPISDEEIKALRGQLRNARPGDAGTV
ncbi:nitroreductase family deazaflavin-dependent oxidoreductase [Nocardia sp. NPDC058499]|uniref:nitroreductase family deazaflavin-dependent oxidoreductase n=1 Tax=Nocardia sp. NPDC058499 TaxID=3346530 RepID=UPI003662ECF8